MTSLSKIANERPNWSLDEFVQVANQLLPKYLPLARSNTRVREDINPRLVRHYTSQGLLDEPLKSGKYAVYTYRHLLQLLVVRRLLSEGIGTSAINHLLIPKTNVELENLLAGGMQIEVTPANPALTYLKHLKSRNPRASEPAVDNSYQTSAPAPTPVEAVQPEKSRWIRLEILSGLEVHVRSEFSIPPTLEEQNLLQQRLWDALTSLSPTNKRDKT